jgi:hypothetical protein
VLLGKALSQFGVLFLEAKEMDLSLMKEKKMEREKEKANMMAKEKALYLSPVAPR